MRFPSHAVIGVLVLGCAREAPPAPFVSAPMASPTPPTPTASVESKSAPEVAPAGARPGPTASPCEDVLPPDDFLERNLADTSMTGLAEIVSASKTDLDGKSPAPSKGLVKIRYEVRVLEWFVGTGPERLVLTQGAEAEFAPRPPGDLLFFSACAADAATGYEPDVGYFFPVNPTCHEDVQARAAAVAKRIPKRTKNAKPAACKR